MFELELYVEDTSQVKVKCYVVFKCALFVNQTLTLIFSLSRYLYWSNLEQ